MKFAKRFLFLCGVFLAAAAGPASAQYMFLDSDGDGAYTAADKMADNGAVTTVRAYVITNKDRLGNTRTCADGFSPAINVISYAVNLQVTGGTATFGAPVTAAPFTTNLASQNPADDLRQYISYADGNAVGLGEDVARLLFTIPVTGATGTPKLDIVIQTTPALTSADPTYFGSSCLTESQFLSTWYLGTTPGDGADWYDVDGLPAAGGVVNTPPTLNAIGNKTVNEGALLSFTATATDPDAGQTLSFSLTLGTPAATGASITSGGAFTWTPTDAQGPGVYPITIAVSDGAGGTDSEAIQVTVNEVNQPPILNAIGNKTVNEGVLLTFPATATDPDEPANTLTFSLTLGTPAATGASITPGSGGLATFTWTPTEAQGPGVYPITIAVSDGTVSDTELINVTVAEANQAPVLAAIGDRTATVGVQLAFTATATDPDLPAQALTFSLTLGSPAATGASITTGGSFTWTPASTGIYPVTITVTDNGTPTLNDSELINITVGGNLAPVLAAIGNKTVNESALLSFTATATDADTPAQTLTFSLALGTPAATGASITAGGAFTWTPTEAQGPGVYPITITVTDDGSPPANDSELIQVTVNELNVAPVLAAIGNKTINEGAQLAFTATGTDADLPAQTLTFSLTLGSPAATGASITPGGSFTWTPSEAQGPGVYPITVNVSDGSLSDDELINVTVNEVNVAPVLAAIGNQAATVGVQLAFTATATDADLPANTLTFSLALGTPAATGASITAGGAFTWTPASTGTYPVTITVTDNGTPNLDDSELFNIQVDIVNAAPELAAIGNKTVNEGALLSFTATATDTDQPPQTLTFSLTLGSPAATGASITTGGDFTWTPTEAQGPGVYPITIAVSDGIASDNELIQVTVNELNVAPVLDAIGNKTINEGSLLAFTATATDGDLPANSLTFSLTLGAPAATGASITAGGAFSWTPTEAQGPDIYPITVNVSDGTVSDDELISVSVIEVNVAPVLGAIGNKVATVGVELVFTVTATDADIPANTLSFSFAPVGPAGATLGSSSGEFRWTPADGDVGPHVVTIQVTDNGIPELSDSETFTITVTRENRAPTLAQPVDMTVEEGATADQSLSGSDPDTDPLTFAKVSGPTFMTVSTLNATTGNVHLAPNFSDSGVHPAEVSASDGTLSDTKSFTITVTDVNRPPVADAGGPYVGTIDVAVAFDGTGSSDPDGDALTYAWTFGDGANGTGATPSHTYTSTGAFDVNLVVSDGILSDGDATTAQISESLAAEAFFIGGNKTTRLGAGKPTTCVQIEPAGGAFSTTDIDLNSITMSYGGATISAIGGKTVVDSDKNGNGIQEIEACFSKDDLRILFASLPSGDNQVDVVIDGSLVGGAQFSATASHRVVVSGKSAAITASPNPFNPETAITFSVARAGRVTAQIYDISGRLVRTLEDRALESGVHTLHWNGSTDAGGRVASGIYFFKLRTQDGGAVQRLTVMK